MNNVCSIEVIQREAVWKFYDGEIDGIAEVARMLPEWIDFVWSGKEIIELFSITLSVTRNSNVSYILLGVS